MKSQRGRGGMRGMRRGRGGGRGRGGRIGGGKMGGDNDDGDGYGDEMEVRLVISNKSCCSFGFDPDSLAYILSLRSLLKTVYLLFNISIYLLFTLCGIRLYVLQDSELILF